MNCVCLSLPGEWSQSRLVFQPLISVLISNAVRWASQGSAHQSRRSEPIKAGILSAFVFISPSFRHTFISFPCHIISFQMIGIVSRNDRRKIIIRYNDFNLSCFWGLSNLINYLMLSLKKPCCKVFLFAGILAKCQQQSLHLVAVTSLFPILAYCLD